MKILVTGANGFIGSAVMTGLSKAGLTPIAGVRDYSNQLTWPVVRIGDLRSDRWVGEYDFAGVESVVHTAGRAHVLDDNERDSLSLFRQINVTATLALAQRAAKAGVKRFIFLSSIGVNGSANTSPFTETDLPNPIEPYAISKLEAELGLWELAQNTGIEIVIIRPPLVYGPYAPGNFGKLFKWVHNGIPLLPLGAIHNKRTLVGLENLVDLITTCILHPDAANQTFLAGDSEDISTPELLQRLAHAIGRHIILVPVPEGLIRIGAALFSKQDILLKLISSLQVDTSKARKLLGWTPPVNLDEGLQKTVEAFLQQTGNSTVDS